MKCLIEGQDWKKLEKFDNDFCVVRSSDEDCTEGSDIIDLKHPKYEAADFFPRYASLYSHEPSAFNLGVYRTPGKNNEDIINATKYVGIMPLIKQSVDGKEGIRENELPLIKISSRFGISPTEMLKEVLSGSDYYENPSMLTTHSYSSSEWVKLKNVEKAKEKIIFGIVTGLGSIDLYYNGKDDGKADKTDIGIVEDYGVFEIIDFVNKAKSLCKNNLKKQSRRVEENLNCKVKGRILVQKQIKYNASKGQNQKTYCAYNKMSEDIRENQIIKYALHLCQKNHGIGDSLVEDIRFCLNSLSGVPLKKCSTSDFVGLKNNGAYRQYKEVLIAAKKVIGRYSVSYSAKTDGSEEKNIRLSSGKVLPYYIDMNLLFEYYCRAIFRKAIDELNIEDKNIVFELESTKHAPRVLFPVSADYWNKHVMKDQEEIIDEEEGINDKEGKMHSYFMPVYIPDIVVNYSIASDKDVEGKEYKTKVAAVFDAKYSDVANQEKRSRTHQIMFYMKSLDCNFGGLISPSTKKTQDNSEVLYTNVSINHSSEIGNPDHGDDNMALFYIPLTYDTLEKSKTDEYVETTKKYLQQIKCRINELERKRNILNEKEKLFKLLADDNNRTDAGKINQTGMEKIQFVLERINKFEGNK